jgi:hypothetical protein
MTLYFRSYERYMIRDKHDPRRRWLIYEFKILGGRIITLKQKLVVPRNIPNELRYL